MNPLLIIFGLMALYGAYAVARAVRQIRRPRKYKDALFTWTEHPGQTFRDDVPTWLALSIHRLALVVLGLLAVLTALLRPQAGLIPQGLSGSAAFFAGPILYGAMALIGFLWGSSLFGPLAESMGGDRHYALSNEGVLIGRQLIPWSALSYFEVDAARNAIHVWSASLPGTHAMVLVLPSSEDLLTLSRLLQSHLLASDPSTPGLIRRYAFPALMAALSVPFIAFACLLYLVPAGIALVADALLMAALMALGAKLIMRLIYGGKARPAALE